MSEDTLKDSFSEHMKKNEETRPEEEKKPQFTITDKRFSARKQQETPEASPEAAEPTLRKPAYVQELEQRVKQSEEQLQKYITAYKQHQAETSAFRERMNKNLETRLDSQMSEFLRELLEIVDNLERSLLFVTRDESNQALLTGIEMIIQQFLLKLKNWGVEQLDRKGQEFDPHLDEVMEIVPPRTEDDRPDTVIEEIQKGYLFKDKLLRPSKVRVIKKPEA